MKKIHRDLCEMRIHIDNLRERERQIRKQQEEIDKKINELKHQDSHKPLFFRLFKGLFEKLADMINLPTKRTRDINKLQKLKNESWNELKKVYNEIDNINKNQDYCADLGNISEEELREYNDKVYATESEISQIRYDARINPSKIVEEFKEDVPEWKNPIHQHRILTFVLDKKIMLDKLAEEHIKEKLATDDYITDEQINNLKRSVYSRGVDIKDIEAALSFAMGQEVSFDWQNCHFVGETFECTIDGKPVGDTNQVINTMMKSRREIILMQEYGEVVAKALKDIAEKQHPELLNFLDDKDFETKRVEGKFVEHGHWYKSYFQGHKEMLAMNVASKCYVESEIVNEFKTVKGNQNDRNPEKVMEYLFAKAEFSRKQKAILEHQKQQAKKEGKEMEEKMSKGMSFHKEGNDYIFKTGTDDKYKVFDMDVSVNDIEAALTYSTQMPVHYDFQSNTFKSAFFEVDTKGDFIHSEMLPVQEYKKLSKFFKKFGKDTAELLKDTAKRDDPSLLTEKKKGFSVVDNLKQMLHKETNTKNKAVKEYIEETQMERNNKSSQEEEVKTQKRNRKEYEPTPVMSVAPEIPKSKGISIEYTGETYKTSDYDDLDEKLKNTHSVFDDIDYLTTEYEEVDFNITVDHPDHELDL